MEKVLTKRNIAIGTLTAAAVGFGIYLWYKSRVKPPAPQPIAVPPPVEETKVGPWYKDPQYDARRTLKHEEANARSRVITSVKYSLCLALGFGKEYQGFIEVKMTLGEQSDGVFLDYYGSEVQLVKINGTEVLPSEVFYNHRINVPAKSQVTGENTIHVFFKNEYSKDSGLCSFTDPTDKLQYLYTSGGAFFTSKIFPCFDQPSLRATLRLTTLTPTGWAVAGNELEEIIVTDKAAIETRLTKIGVMPSIADSMPAEYEMRIFKQTPRLSPHSYAVFAGAFKEYKAKEEGIGALPMRILCLDSMVPSINEVAEKIFRVLQKGMKYCQQLFFVRFPFGKLDHVFVPCPGFTRRTFAGVSVITQTSKIAPSLLESITNSWLGNSISVKWWNSYVLHQGLTGLVASMALTQAEGLESLRSIGFAHSIPLLDAFHSEEYAVENEVKISEEAEDFFISSDHRRASAVMKQLCYVAGEKVFKAGLVEFAKKFKDKCIEVQDFINCVKAAAAKLKIEVKLEEWVDEWLKNKGVNTLVVEDLVSEQGNSHITISQTLSNDSTNIYRSHKIDIALYSEATFAETLMFGIITMGSEKFTLELDASLPKQAAVLLNANGHDFAKAYIDTSSLAAFKENLSKVQNYVNRMLVYENVALMVRDGVITASEFIELVVAQIPKEDEVEVINTAFQYVKAILEENVPKQYQEAEAEKLFDTLYTKAMNEKEDAKKGALFEIMPHFAYSKKHRDVLLGLLVSMPEAILLSQSARYNIMKVHFKDPTIPPETKNANLKNQERKTAEYEKVAFECEACSPDIVTKKRLWSLYLATSTTEPSILIRASMKAFWVPEQHELLKPFVDEFFNNIQEVFVKRDLTFAIEFFNSLKPKVYDSETLKKFEKLSIEVEEDQRVLQQLVRREVEKRAKLLKSHEKYLASLKK